MKIGRARGQGNIVTSRQLCTSGVADNSYRIENECQLGAASYAGLGQPFGISPGCKTHNNSSYRVEYLKT